MKTIYNLKMMKKKIHMIVTKIMNPKKIIRNPEKNKKNNPKKSTNKTPKKLGRTCKFSTVEEDTPKEIAQAVLKQCNCNGSMFKFKINMDWNAFKAMFITGFENTSEYIIRGLSNENESLPKIVNIEYEPVYGYLSDDVLKPFFGIKLQNKHGDKFHHMDIVYSTTNNLCKIWFSMQASPQQHSFSQMVHRLYG